MHKAQSGFTVTELMLVLVVTGMTLAIGAPVMKSLMDSNKLRGAAGQMQGHMTLARQRAVAERVPRILAWDYSAREYRIVRDNDGDGVPDTGEPVIGPFSLPHGVTLANDTGNPFTNPRVTFAPDGTASESGVLVLSDPEGKQVKVVLRGLQHWPGSNDKQGIFLMLILSKGPIKERDGFSLVELMIALTFLSIGLMAVAQMIPLSAANSTQARVRTDAVEIAKEKMERLQSQPFSSPDLAPGTHTETNGNYSLAWTITDNQPVVGNRRIIVNTSWEEATGTQDVRLVSYVYRK